MKKLNLRSPSPPDSLPAGGEVFLGNSLQDMGSVGPATLDTIDEETERLVEEAKGRAIFVLTGNWSVVGEIARALLDQETLSGIALEALLSPVAEIGIDEIDLSDRPADVDREV